MSLKIIDFTKQFIKLNQQAMDRALNRMVIDIERQAKMEVPVGPTKKISKSSHGSGQLKSSGHHVRDGELHYLIVFNKEYAMYQHEGQRKDGSHVIKNHTYPGKKTHYVRDPALRVGARAAEYFKQEAASII